MDSAHGVHHLGRQFVGLSFEGMEGCIEGNDDNHCDGNSDNYFIGADCGVWQFIEGINF